MPEKKVKENKKEGNKPKIRNVKESKASSKIDESKIEEQKLGLLKLKKKTYIYNTGHRKTSGATVRLYKKGEGKIEINGLDLEKYFGEEYLQRIVTAPLELVTQRTNLNVSVKVNGGGKKGQAEAIRNGIAKALLELNPNFRKPLKKAGFLTRDARKKERKKFGKKGARRGHQWRKR